MNFELTHEPESEVGFFSWLLSIRHLFVRPENAKSPSRSGGRGIPKSCLGMSWFDNQQQFTWFL